MRRSADLAGVEEARPSAWRSRPRRPTSRPASTTSGSSCARSTTSGRSAAPRSPASPASPGPPSPTSSPSSSTTASCARSAAARRAAARRRSSLEVDHDARLVVGLDLGEEHFAGASSTSAARSAGRSRCPSRAATATPPLAARLRPPRPAPRREHRAAARHRHRDAGPRRQPDRHDPPGGQPRLARPAARRRSSASATASRSNVANDSQAAALAEYTYAGEGRVPNLIAIRVGRGVGAGLVLRGALFQGDGSGAGEIGHIVVDDDGALCRCGRTGCLETVASMRAIETRASDVAGRPTDLARASAAALDAGERLGDRDRRRRRRARSAARSPA